MKIRLLSDLHQEFFEDPQLYKSHGEDVLVIAGDLHVGAQACWSALKRFAENTPHVVYVPGNHEYYRTSIQEFDDYIKRFSQNTNIHFLNPGTTKIGDVSFIGATLWTDFRSDQFAKFICGRRISDFHVIRGFDTDACVRVHTQHLKYIKEAYSKIGGKKCIITHFLPAVETIAAEFQGPDLLNYYFANDLAAYIQDLQDTTWLFGHTHTPVDLELGTCRVVANPYGYNKNPSWQEKFILC